MRAKFLAGLCVVSVLGGFFVSAAGGVAGASVPGKAAKYTGAPIKIGVTLPCNAAIPPAICEIGPSAKAVAKTINAKGGAKTADGKTHELQVLVCQNDNDRSKTADCARQFVDAKVTFATGAASFADEIVPVLANAGIAYFDPTVASSGTAEGVGKTTYILGFTLGLFQGLVEQLANHGFKKIVAVAQGQGTAIGGLTKPIAQARGADVTVVEAPQTNPDWAQIAAQATGSGADVIFTVTDKDGTKAFVDALATSGKKVPVTSVIGIITDDVVKATGGKASPLKGGISTGYFQPPSDPAWADYRAGMKKYAKGTLLEPASQTTWQAIQLATEIIKTMNGDPTAAAFIDAVNATTSIPTLNGKLPPGKSFQKPEGIFPRIFNNDYWGPLTITATGLVNAKGAQYAPAPSK